MFKFDITNSFFYKWRYVIGYTAVGIGLVSALIIASLFTPGGISVHEMDSVVKSNSIDFTNLSSLAIENLPYHLLQKASIAILGVSIVSIKLPSIILALLSAIGLILLLKSWYKANVGVLASLIAVTTGQFLFIAQDGTPNILYLFWSVWLLLLANQIYRQQKFRMIKKIMIGIIAALSMYTPLSIYVLVALFSAIILHPHLRYIIKQFSIPKVIFGTIMSLLILSPLFLAISKDPNLGLSMIGVSTNWPDLGANFSDLAAQYFGFAKPGGTTIMTPFFELGSMLIIAVGIVNVIQTKSTAKSYIIALWVICLTPVIILNPSYTSITFLPLVLLLSSGINKIIGYWYRLFPLNPYARATGLVPIVILVSVLVLSGADRFMNGYRYDPTIAPNFSKDLNLIPKDTTDLVVSEKELPFYQVVARYSKTIQVSTLPNNNTVLATRDAKKNIIDYKIDRIITSSFTNDSDRFYLLKK